MTKKAIAREPQPTVVVAVFEDLIKRLEADAAIDASVVQRLREKLLQAQDSSTAALKAALFSEEPLP